MNKIAWHRLTFYYTLSLVWNMCKKSKGWLLMMSRTPCKMVLQLVSVFSLNPSPKSFCFTMPFAEILCLVNVWLSQAYECSSYISHMWFQATPIGYLTPQQQEQAAVKDLLAVLSGIEGRHILVRQGEEKYSPRRFILEPTMGMIILHDTPIFCQKKTKKTVSSG